jgi:hypothetical protein
MPKKVDLMGGFTVTVACAEAPVTDAVTVTVVTWDSAGTLRIVLLPTVGVTVPAVVDQVMEQLEVPVNN